MTPRTLTHDERKAAHAAFTGQPSQPRWSLNAKTIYDGIRAELTKTSSPSTTDPVPDTEAVTPQLVPPGTSGQGRPLQAWHLHLTEPSEQQLLLIPWQVPLPSVMQYLEHQYPQRVFTLQAIEGGQHPCQEGHALILARPIITSDHEPEQSERR